MWSSRKGLQKVPIFARTKFVLATLALLAVYSYGWKVTEINLSDLFSDFHLVKPLVRELARPDLFSRQIQKQITETEFFLIDDSNRTKKKSISSGKQHLYLSKRSGKVGDRLIIAGLRLRSNSKGKVFWVNEIEQEFPLGDFATDSSGKFQKDISVPPSAMFRNTFFSSERHFLQ